MKTAIAIAVLGLACGKSPTVVARLEKAVATVERMPEPNAAWEPATPGDTFVIGSGVRTGKASVAHLRVGTSGKLDVDPVSVVYFRRKTGHDKEHSEVQVETGRVELEAGDEAVAIGDAVLESGGRAEIAHGSDGTTVIVQIGRVILEDSTLRPGQRVTLDDSGRRATPGSAAPVVGESPVRSPASATMVKLTGKASVKTATGETSLEPGEHDLEPGARVKLPEGSIAVVSRGESQLAISGPGEFQIGGSPENLATVTRGGVALQTSAPTVVSVPGGSITVTAGAASAQIDREGSTIANHRGGTTIGGAKSGDKKLAAGEIATLAPDGTVAVLPPPPARAVLSIAAGESATLHDAKAPTAIHLRFPEGCPSGIVDVAKDRAFTRPIARSAGTGGANVLVTAGSFHYRVRCNGGKLVRGTIQVARDSGRTPLPKTAARTLVEMDGREYTILYQNLLPELTLSWRNPSFAVRYAFVVKSATGPERRFTSPAARVILKAGELREGSYKIWAEPEGGTRSETSRIVIEFDNATPSASIDGLETLEGKVRIKGTVLVGSTVTSSTGTAIELDRHRRFATDLVPPNGDDGVGVRIAHPKLGIHYYVFRTGL